MEAFDTKSGQPIVVDNPEQMREGILSGQFGFKKNAKINVFKGDEVYNIPAVDVYNALKNGWEIETPNLTAVREYLKENDNLVGSLKVGAYEFANALTMSVPDIIMRNTANPLEWAKFNALRDEHVTASLLGEVSGLGANIYSLARAGVLAATEKISEKAINVVANRITATFGKGVSKSAANQAARGILAKTASKLGQGVGVVGRNVGQGAIEGALDMAVPASVEALFGNYEEAAETLLVGSAFGGLLGGTLRTAGDSVNAAKRSLFGKSAIEGQGSKLQESMLQLASTYTNIPIDTLRYTLRNAADVDNALPMTKHFDDLNRAAQAEFDIYQTAKNELKDIDDTLIEKTKIKARQMDELAKAPNSGIDDQIVASTKQMKNWLEDQSYIAEEALANEIALSKVDLTDYQKTIQKAIDKISKGKVGKKAGQTLSNLESLSNDFAALNNRIDGNTARSVLRNIREEINFNEADPTLFDTELDKVLKGLQKNLSDTLKIYSPTYKAQMDAMAPKARALDQLGPFVSNQTKRLQIGKALTTDKPTASQLVVTERMEQFFDAAEEIEGLERIRDIFGEAVRDQRSAYIFDRARKQMLDSKTTKAKEEFYKTQFPDEYELLQQKKAALGEAQINWDALRPLVTNDGRVLESNIKVTDTKNIALDRAYDNLAQRYPSELGDIKKKIKDTKINESLEKARTQGSRATLLFGSMGAATGIGTGVVGAVLGGAIGATTGAYIDRFGGKLIGKILEDSPGASKIRSLLVAEKQMSKFAAGLDNIPNHINQIASKKNKSSAYRKINRATNHVLLRILNRDKEQPKDDKLLDRKLRVEAFREFSKKLSDLSNPERMFEELSGIAGATADGGTPAFGAKAMEKMGLGISYLQKEIPKDPNPESLFVKPGQEWEPSDYDLRAFEEKLTVINDPLIVFDALEADILTENHISALREIYPSLYGHITNKVLESLSENSDLPYAEMIGLSQIIGVPFDSSMTAESFSFFQPTPKEQAAEQSGPSNSQLARINIDTRQYQSRSSEIRNI